MQVEKQMAKEAWAARFIEEPPKPEPEGPKVDWNHVQELRYPYELDDWVKSDRIMGAWEPTPFGQEPSWDEEESETHQQAKMARKILSQPRPNVRGHQW